MKVSVLVKPGSKRGPKIIQTNSNSYVIFLRERPHDGEANVALVKLLAEHFGVPKTSITIKSGVSSRHKIVEF